MRPTTGKFHLDPIVSEPNLAVVRLEQRIAQDKIAILAGADRERIKAYLSLCSGVGRIKDAKDHALVWRF